MHTELEQAPTLTVRATPAQEAMWWLHQRVRDKSVYAITWRLACDRPVDTDALAAAWRSLVDRHEALRTSLVRDGESINLVTRPRVDAQLRLVDIDPADAIDPDTVLRLIAEESQGQEFVLEADSLARLAVVRVGGRHELLLTAHHLVVDGWGMHLLVDDLSVAYAAAAAGRPVEFAAEPVPFSEYAAAQRGPAAEQRWRAATEHWQAALDGAAATTVAAATDSAYLPGAPGRVIRHRFPDDACAAVATIARRTYATPFAVFHGAMHIVLARGGAGPDVTIGAVLANRTTPREQAVVGYLANLCLSRATVSDDDTVAEVMTRARDKVWAMLTHQAAPYPVVFAGLSERTRSRLTDDSPIGLSHLGPIGTGLRLGDVGLTLLPSPNRAARADISISTWEDAGQYHAEIEFDSTRYDEETVRRLLHDLGHVLVEAARDGDQPVGGIRVRSRTATALADRARLGAPAGSTSVGSTADGVGSTGIGSGGVGSGGVGSGADSPVVGAEREVLRVWTEVIGTPPATPDADFFASGGNSLALVQLAADVQAATGIEVDAVEWLAEPTPRRLITQIVGDAADGAVDTGSGQPRADSGTCVTLRDGTGIHLHLLHGAGGGPADFRDIVNALPADWKVTASRERVAAASVPELARSYRAGLDEAGSTPDILCGWSMGGLVAYEMAATLERRPSLVLLDAPPPRGYRPDPEETLFAGFAGAFLGSAGGSLVAVPRTTGDAEFRTAVLAACLTAVGATVTREALAKRWATYLRHARMGEAYIGPARLPVDALIIAADATDDDTADWVGRLSTSVQLRLDTDHYGVLRAAVEVAAAIVKFTESTKIGEEQCSTRESCSRN